MHTPLPGRCAAILFAITCSALSQARSQAQQPAGSAVLIVPFAVADGAAAASTASKCPSDEITVHDVPDGDRTEILAALSTELQARLSKTTPAQVSTAATEFPAGSTVLGGCITRMDGGNAKMRIVGAGMGASVLTAHVVVSRSQDGKLEPLQQFDVEAKGRNFGVGSGMLINAMRTKRTSLQGDAVSLADKIVKGYNKHEGTLPPTK